MSMDGDALGLPASIDDHWCCGTLTLEDIATCVRFSITCGEGGRCARKVLRGDGR